MKNKASIWRSISMGLFVVAGVLIYSYGFQVTKVNVEETRSERRQTQLFRILRALVRPEILEYEKDEFFVETPIWISCPVGEALEPDKSGPYMIITPPCADPNDEVTVEGFNFEPNTKGPINFIPPSGVKIQRGNIETDADGHFITTIEIPNRRPVDEAQLISVITRRNVGSPTFTQTAKDTWDKIVETVFMALLATTLGTALAIPISFFAARNLMKDVSAPLLSASLSIVFWPIGIYLGLEAAKWVTNLISPLMENGFGTVAGLGIGAVLTVSGFRWALPETEIVVPTLRIRIFRWLVLGIASAIGVASIHFLANLSALFGNSLEGFLKSFGFLGTFIADLGDILGNVTNMVVALSGGAILGNLAGRLGHRINETTSKKISRLIGLPISAVAGVVVLVFIGYLIEWLYQIGNPAITLWWPAGIGAVLGLIIAARLWTKDTLSFGLAIYYVTRTILNTLRSIEPLIMVIVFAVWVGIGPFAGVLALSLHTIAALAKLYSEQVESILPGPLEAIRASGATRIQTIVYAVVPQIVPPYIAFTMYRWDINVRMSTIIGFAGGGGIGFLLQQNINLLNYRAASAQMFAIAIVVASMDYISSRLREKVT